MKRANFHAANTVLMFEGGGMRASYTAAMASLLLEQNITFGHVCGISAGSSHTVNYLSGDIWRTRASFTDLVMEPEFGGAKTFAQGKGMFSAHWIYEEAGLPEGVLPFNFEAFAQNPTPCSIQAFDRDTGESVVWHKEDMATLEDLMVRVRASSTLPVVMPPVHIGDHVYYDGGLGVGAGIPLQLALDSASAKAIANSYHRYPKVKEALLTRNKRYNAELEKLEALAEEGKAYIVYAEKMAVSNSTTDLERLRASYFDGYNQYQDQLPEILEWLKAGE